MAVEKIGEKYRCNVCGNEVLVTKVGGGVLGCCGKEMEKIDTEQYSSTPRSLPDTNEGDGAGDGGGNGG